MSEPAEAPEVVKVARDLTEIEKLSVAIEAQALAKSTDRLMPGGRAMVSLGPDADLEEWSEMIAAAELRHFAVCDLATHKDCVIHGAEHLADEDDQNDEDPLRTLLFWSDDWRALHGYPLEGRTPTLVTEARFIRHFLDFAWSTLPEWKDFANDINRARRTLEDVLTAGSRTERTRVPCDRCETTPEKKAPNLIRVHAPRKQVGVCCSNCGTLADMTERERCPVCWTHAPAGPLWASDERDDWWKCKTCKHKFDADEFDRAHKKHLRSEGARKFVPLIEALATLHAQGRPERTIRKWLAVGPDEAGYVDRRATTQGLEVWWPDIWTKHLTTAMRQSKPREVEPEEPEDDPTTPTLNEYRAAVRAAQQRSA